LIFVFPVFIFIFKAATRSAHKFITPLALSIQKPVKILEHIINIASNENDVVLDMFMGVGSTGVAALNLNRRFIGVEIDKDYYNASVNRIENAYPREERKICFA